MRDLGCGCDQDLGYWGDMLGASTSVRGVSGNHVRNYTTVASSGHLHNMDICGSFQPSREDHEDVSLMLMSLETDRCVPRIERCRIGRH